MKILNKPQTLLILILTLSFLGFLDSTYLTILHYKNAFPPCQLLQKCELVLTSQYSEFLGIPVSLFGSIFYFVAIMLPLLIFEFKKRTLLNFLLIWSIIGILASLYFFFIQAFILHAFCQYCLFSELISVLILISSLLLYRLALSSASTESSALKILE